MLIKLYLIMTKLKSMNEINFLKSAEKKTAHVNPLQTRSPLCALI